VKQRRADLVARLANKKLLHLELQSDNDDNMLWRELEYCSLITQRHQQVPLQIVLYVGAAPANFEVEINTDDLKYRYHLIDIKKLDCTALLESESLSDNLLALLGKLQDKAVAVQRVMYKIAQLPKRKRSDMLEKLAILVGLRPAELPRLIQKEATMPISIDLEQNPLFAEIFERYTKLGEQVGELRGEQRGIQIGKQQGQQQGKLMMLRNLLEKRFGSLPSWVNSRLEQATAQELEQWSLQLFDAIALEDVFKSLD
jgi:predicted transposase YdaD